MPTFILVFGLAFISIGVFRASAFPGQQLSAGELGSTVAHALVLAVLYTFYAEGGVAAGFIPTAIYASWWIVQMAQAKERKEAESARQSIILQTDKIIGEKIDALSRRRAQLLQADQYGTIKKDKWIEEVGYFFNTVVVPNLDQTLAAKAMTMAPDLLYRIEEATYDYSTAQPTRNEFSDDMTAIDYEHYCAEELRAAGWDARVTQASRDQGVDVVAERNGVRLVVQCKLYSKAVGNGAVQEIVAAKVHENADIGAVVSNNSYTSSAQELAATNKILLLHHRDLIGINRLLGMPEVERPPAAPALEAPTIETSKAPTVKEQVPAQVALPQMAIAAAAMIGLVALFAIPISMRSTAELKGVGSSTSSSGSTSSVAAHTPPSAVDVAKATEPAPAATGQTRRFTCKTTKGDVSDVTITVGSGSISVIHTAKAGPINMASHYIIKDTSDDSQISWTGVSMINAKVTIKGRISRGAGGGHADYVEEVIGDKGKKATQIVARCW